MGLGMLTVVIESWNGIITDRYNHLDSYTRRAHWFIIYNSACINNPMGIYLFKVNNRNTRTRC